jgi:phosphohistidine phosphatase
MSLLAITQASYPMKHLSILRHAKAEPIADFPNDFDRPLTSRGVKDARHTGQLLATIAPAVDWIVSSPAQRTRDTADAVVEKLGFARGVIWQAAIYAAEAETLLTVIAQTPDDAEHLLIIGHNPGMAELVSGLVAGSPSRLGMHMPTAGLAYITLELFAWNKIRWGSGTLHFLLRPKLLRGK